MATGSTSRAPDLPGYPQDIISFLECEDFDGYNPQNDTVLEEDDMPPEARKLPARLKRMVRNAHRNLGHPSNFSLVRLMTVAKCHPDMIEYARHMKCPTCQRRNPPQQRIPDQQLLFCHQRRL